MIHQTTLDFRARGRGTTGLFAASPDPHPHLGNQAAGVVNAFARHCVGHRHESLHSVATAASFSARSADSSSRAISRSSAACALSLPMRSRFSKVIFAANNENLALRN